MKTNINNLIKILNAKVLCGEELLEKDVTENEITGGYACDMLSRVISMIKTGEAWFTILNSINVVAVATLSDCACVVLTEGVEMEAGVLKRAIDNQLIVISTSMTTYESCATLYKALEAAKK